MLEGFLGLLQSPEFQTFVATYTATKLLDAAGSKIKQLKDLSRKKTPEWQFLRCLDLAFIATEKELGWDHTTDAVYDIFEDSLLTHHGSFTLDSLKEIYEAAVSHSVSISDLEVWVRHFKREFAMGDFKELEKFFNIDHYFQTSSTVKSSESKYILTRNAPMCENPDIIFRDTIVHDLLEKVSVAGSRVQIAGMGGLGKTEILNKLYAQLAKDKQHTVFDHIALITFSGEIASDIESQIDYPRPYLGLQGVEAAKRYLQDVCQEKNVLLCIDDIRPNQTILKRNDPSLVLLRSLGASVLLTSRVAYPEFEVLDLNFLPTNACISIFEKQYGRAVSDTGDITTLTEIIENLAGNHTMIVNRLGNMAKDYGWSIPTLSERLKEKNFSFSKGIDDDELLQHEINKLYQINDELSPAEINILEAFSIFPASPLPFDLCVDWLHEDAGIDDDKCALLLNKLAEQTWLEKRCDNESNDVYFLMHQLVRTAVHEQSFAKLNLNMSLVNNCRDLLQSSTEQFDFSKAASIIPFAVSIFRALFADEASLAYLSAAIAYYYFKSGDYSCALEWYQKDLIINEKVLGKDHLDTATTYSRIALIYNLQGKYDLALGWNQKTLVIRERVLGKDHPDTATTYSNIALVYYNQGQYDLALEWYKKDLAISERILGKDHPDTATTYNNIALVNTSQGQYDLALEWFLKALVIFEKGLGKDHPDTATIYNNIALVYNLQGQYNLALEWHQKASVIRERVLGKDHPDTASIYNNIAGVYYNQGQYSLALTWNQKALVIHERMLGKDHPDTAITYNNIASVYDSQGKYDLALEWYQKALVIYEKVLGKDHPDTANTYNNIAVVYGNQGQYDLALEWYRKALTTFQRTLGPEHPYTISTGKAVFTLEKLAKTE